MKITFYGASSRLVDSKYIEAVERLGEAMANRGHELIFGGGKNGLMGAIVRGVKRAGGKATGIIPEFFKETHFEELYENSDEIIWTKNMYDRKFLLENMADAFIIAPGGIGTYDEFCGVLTSKQLKRHFKPIALYSIEGFYDKFVEFLEDSINEKFINENCRDLFKAFSSEEGLMDYLENGDNEHIDEDFKIIQ